MNFYQHTKNEAVSWICSGEMEDLKILQCDWLRASFPMSEKKDFPQIWNLFRNTANDINFHYRKNSVKINDQIFLQIQKPYFGLTSPILGEKIFLQNIQLSQII